MLGMVLINENIYKDKLLKMIRSCANNNDFDLNQVNESMCRIGQNSKKELT